MKDLQKSEEFPIKKDSHTGSLSVDAYQGKDFLGMLRGLFGLGQEETKEVTKDQSEEELLSQDISKTVDQSGSLTGDGIVSKSRKDPMNHFGRYSASGDKYSDGDFDFLW
ncbi:MAG: hypothetical protein R8G66_05860 [Cytophagales bacterium]|nr:hypothetical protein [Cytophagales bacterium]